MIVGRGREGGREGEGEEDREGGGEREREGGREGEGEGERDLERGREIMLLFLLVYTTYDYRKKLSFFKACTS